MNNKALLVDLYELTMAQVYFKYKRNASATFDLFIRSPRRPFYVACGIDEAIGYLENARFTREDIDYLKGLALFEDDFLEYLQAFKFSAQVWGLEEPEIVFPQEPILRVSGNLIEIQIVESLLLNTVNLATTLASKAARVVLAAQGRGVYDFSLRRAQGESAALAAAKYSYVVGAKGTSNVYAGFLYKIPVVGTMAHSFIMSFEREIESFLAFAQQFPAKSTLLVDTYDVKKGITSAIQVAKFLRKRGCELLGIRLDSGALAEDAKHAREVLDREGLIDTLIFASGNLDEYKIEKLIKEKAPVDAYGVGTNMGCSSDVPFTDVIYKLVEIKERGRDFIPTMKLSKGKTTLPSRKQVFRVLNKKGAMEKDYIGLDREGINGKKLLKKLMDKGRRPYKEKTLDEKRKIFAQKLKALPSVLRKMKADHNYPVRISKKLSALADGLKGQMQERISPKVVFIDIDTQYDFLNKGGSLYVKGSEHTLKNLKKLTDFAKQNAILIISSQDTHKADDPEFKQFPPHCTQGSKGYQKIKETLLDKHTVLTFKKICSPQELRTISRVCPQIILEKNNLNVFSNPNTINLLEAVFPDKIYVYGVATEYCIREAVEGLLKMGFEVVLIEDAIKEISGKEKERLFSLWKKRGLHFTTTQRVLSELVHVHTQVS
ncbi:MAG: nicotinate phosphoribosyltransferase [Candidatus Omnitrophota bacterium]|nr:MAG: nicotinate phosphoribosyltransferase [Candidatus Omnitrophota bacterium]